MADARPNCAWELADNRAVRSSYVLAGHPTLLLIVPVEAVSHVSWALGVIEVVDAGVMTHVDIPAADRSGIRCHVRTQVLLDLFRRLKLPLTDDGVDGLLGLAQGDVKILVMASDRALRSQVRCYQTPAWLFRN